MQKPDLASELQNPQYPSFYGGQTNNWAAINLVQEQRSVSPFLEGT